MLMGAKTYDGAKVPMHFRSWNESCQERKFSETNVTFAAGSESTKERKGPFPCFLRTAYCHVTRSTTVVLQ